MRRSAEKDHESDINFNTSTRGVLSPKPLLGTYYLMAESICKLLIAQAKDNFLIAIAAIQRGGSYEMYSDGSSPSHHFTSRDSGRPK